VRAQVQCEGWHWQHSWAPPKCLSHTPQHLTGATPSHAPPNHTPSLAEARLCHTAPDLTQSERCQTVRKPGLLDGLAQGGAANVFRQAYS